MSLDDELDELSLNPTDSFARQRAKFISGEIEQRDADYDHLLRTSWEVGAQLDGMQLVRWAFRRGWEIGTQHGRDQMEQRHRDEQRYYR